MTKYNKKNEEKVAKVLHEFKEGKLKMGRSGKKVKSRKQAIAIGLSETRAGEIKLLFIPKSNYGYII